MAMLNILASNNPNQIKNTSRFWMTPLATPKKENQFSFNPSSTTANTENLG
jgi:hypothetical protein